MKNGFLLISISVFFLVFFSCKQKNTIEDERNFKLQELKAYAQLLSAKTDSVGLRLIVANKLDSIGDYKHAILQMDTLIQNDSTKYGLWMAKANILLDSGDTISAKGSYIKAMNIYGGNEALLSLAEIFAAQKNDSCLLLTRQFNDQSVAYKNYVTALYFYYLNDYNKSDSLLNKAMIQDHNFVKSYLLKGKIRAQKNQWQNAINFFDEGLNREPKNIALLNGVGGTYLNNHQTDSAKIYFSKSLMQQPFQPKIEEQLKKLK